MKIVLPNIFFRIIFTALTICLCVSTLLFIVGMYAHPKCFGKTSVKDSVFCKSFRKSAFDRGLKQIESVWTAPYEIGRSVRIKRRYISEDRFMIEYSTVDFSVLKSSREKIFSEVHQWICEKHSGAKFIVLEQKLPNLQIVNFFDGAQYTANYAPSLCENKDLVKWVKSDD